jgi:hypothetical protein
VRRKFDGPKIYVPGRKLALVEIAQEFGTIIDTAGMMQSARSVPKPKVKIGNLDRRHLLRIEHVDCLVDTQIFVCIRCRNVSSERGQRLAESRNAMNARAIELQNFKVMVGTIAIGVWICVLRC